MECSICSEKFTGVLRKKITCPVETCNQEICKKCVERWLKERTNITCPYCNTVWSYKFALENIGKAFMEKYKKVQKELLLTKEKTYLEETQNFIDIEKELENQYVELSKYNKLHDKYGKMRIAEMKKDKYLNEIKIFEIYKKKVEVSRYFKDMKINISENIRNMRKALEVGDITCLEGQNIKRKIDMNKPVCPCPVNECRGYIKSFTYKCGICETKICKDCNVIEVNDTEHVCKEEDKLTVATIVKESKPCPKCGTRIQKSEGCSQMYCTQCKTAFDYRTGKIETGRIHNPHYYEELRKIHGDNMPREPGDNPGCDNDLEQINFIGNSQMIEYLKIPMAGHEYIVKDARKITNMYTDIMCFYIDMHRKYYHILDHIGTYEPEYETTFKTNFIQRFRYLKKETTEDNFKTYIYRKFKENMYKKEVHSEINSYLKTIFILLKNEHPHLEEINKNYRYMHKEGWVRSFNAKMKVINEINNIIMSVEKKLITNLNEICKTYDYKPTFKQTLMI